MDGVNAWDYGSVCSYIDKCLDAEKTGKTIHFGRVFPLCHIKHSELGVQFHEHKGRCIFGGNDIRDENGVIAVFQEQGASASSMVASKLLDALARTPGYAGENADAYKVYTECLLADLEGSTQTWVEIPSDRRPDDWFWDGSLCSKPKYVRRVVRLLRNLYGHPLATTF